MVDSLLSLDQSLLLFFNGYHSPMADTVMTAISHRFFWIPLYVVLAVMLFVRSGWRRAIVWLISIALLITVTDQVCASVIRPAVARLRPCDPANPFSAMVTIVRGYCPGSYSFPSCHAANTFALAVFLSLVFRRRPMTWFMLVWASVVSLSRLYLGVHHPSDILAGAAIGSLLGYVIYLIASHIRPGRKSVAVCVSCFVTFTASGQKFEWGGEFSAFFDNREGSARHTAAETYFLTRLAPELGVSFAGGRHKVMAGAVWLQPIGCEWDGKRISPTAYYRYESCRICGSLGMFPRSQLLRPLPEYLVSDSVRYSQGNMRGALIQYLGTRGFFEAMLDWRGMQSRTRREAFSVVAQGRWASPRKVSFMAGGTAMLNHLAKVKDAPADQYVVDNMIVNPEVGLDLLRTFGCGTRITAMDISVGPLASLTRDRMDGVWRKSLGVRADVNVGWWRLKLRNIFWYGSAPLFPLYTRFGSQLNDGEPYYSSRYYNRTELSGQLVSYRDIVSLKAELDFHVADKSDFMFYQRLILTVKI